jgi:hypothetical protein
MKEISDEIRKFQYNLVALQIIRWQGQGRVDKIEYSLLCSGSDRTGKFARGFIISKGIRNNLLEFEAINQRICEIHIKG